MIIPRFPCFSHLLLVRSYDLVVVVAFLHLLFRACAWGTSHDITAATYVAAFTTPRQSFALAVLIYGRSGAAEMGERERAVT